MLSLVLFVLRTGRPGTDDIAAYLPATVELVLVAFVIALQMGGLYVVVDTIADVLQSVADPRIFVS